MSAGLGDQRERGEKMDQGGEREKGGAWEKGGELGQREDWRPAGQARLGRVGH